MYWIEVLSNLKEICSILFAISILVLVCLGTLIACEKHDLFKSRVKDEKAVILLDPWVSKAFNLNCIVSIIFLLVCVFVPHKSQLIEIYGPGEIIEHLRHGDIEGLSEESVIYFERWAAGETTK